MVLFEQLQGSQSLDTAGVPGGVGEFTGGSCMLVHCDGGVGRMGCYGCGLRMIMRL